MTQIQPGVAISLSAYSPTSYRCWSAVLVQSQQNDVQAHQVLGKETIRCRIRKGSKTTLKMHMM